MEAARSNRYIDSNKVDRISKLPEEILHHILCFLNLKAAAKTCALSKAWRYVWCTRPELLFIPDRTLSLSVIDKIFQSYHDRNLRLEQFALCMSSKGDPALLLNKWLPILIHDMGVKSLDLNFRNQSPSLSFILESDTIQNLSLQRCKLETQVHVDSKRLQTLSLCHVFIPEEIMDNILSNCPFLEYVSLMDCWGFNRIKLSKNINKPTNLAHFYFHNVAYLGTEIRNDAQTLETIEIDNCLLFVSHNKPFEFARLTRLSLTRVKLMSSGLFSCNLHSLEELKLDECSGIKEFKLSSRSMKRLSIRNISKPLKATIDAPSIVSFNYDSVLPRSISFATTSSSDGLWKSKINFFGPSLCFNKLYGLLDALRQSKISLGLDQYEIRRLWRQLPIGVTEPKHLPAVAVEHLTIKRPEKNMHPSAAPFLKRLFLMFRPSFIYMSIDMLTNSRNEHHEIAELPLQGKRNNSNEA